MKHRIVLFLGILVLLFIPSVSAEFTLTSSVFAPMVLGTSSGSTTLNTSLTVTFYNTGVVSTDLLLACINFNGDPGTITYPAGWSEAFMGTNTYQMRCMYKFDNSASVVITHTSGTQHSFVSYAIHGAKFMQLIGPSTSITGSSTNPDPPLKVSVTPSNVFLSIAAYTWGNNNFCTSSSFPAGYVNPIKEDAGTGGISAYSAMATKEVAATSDDPGTATLSASCKWIATTIAVLPPEDVNPISVSVDISVILLYLILIGLTLFLGIRAFPEKNPLHLFLAGLASVFFALMLFTITGNVPLTILWFGVALFIIIDGIAASLKTSEES